MIKTGIEMFDAQHQILEQALRDIEVLLSEGLPAKNEWQEFVRKTEAHMLSEEVFLQKHGYPELQAHAVSHRWALKDLAAASGDRSRMLAARARMYAHTGNYDSMWAEWLRKHGAHRDPGD